MRASMDTFKGPISPSHLATTAGMVLASVLPGIPGETRGIIAGAIAGVYVLGESVYSGIKAHGLKNEEIEILRRLANLDA